MFICLCANSLSPKSRDRIRNAALKPHNKPPTYLKDLENNDHRGRGLPDQKISMNNRNTELKSTLTVQEIINRSRK